VWTVATVTVLAIVFHDVVVHITVVSQFFLQKMKKGCTASFGSGDENPFGTVVYEHRGTIVLGG